ncbi:hypothetical protein [Alkaliphilus pronyensis]|uniref:hypothetical protein n=1 Tax=Alkaliphilus pronyensis TaxID=1482732 RepID=UPI002ED07595
MAKSHTHSHNTRTNTTVIRYSITYNRTRNSIHDKPDVTFDATNFINQRDGSRPVKNWSFFLKALIISL